jgi:outer membrane protein assembly factor BamB
MFTPSLMLSLGILVASPGNWPGFLDARQASIDEHSIPVEWGPEQGIAWRWTTAGYGQSSPVIWADRAYLTSVEGPLKDHLIISAIELNAGELLWQQRFPTSDPVESGTFVSRAAPTPVVDDAGVYCFFESGDVIALDHDGELRWHRSLSREYDLKKGTGVFSRTRRTPAPFSTIIRALVVVGGQRQLLQMFDHESVNSVAGDLAERASS